MLSKSLTPVVGGAQPWPRLGFGPRRIYLVGGFEHGAGERMGSRYTKRGSEVTRYMSKEDYRKAAKTSRKAITLEPDEPAAYFNLGNALSCSGHMMEAAQRYLEAMDRFPAGSVSWAETTAIAVCILQLEECDEVAKPEWWNDKEIKALSARVVRAAPNNLAAIQMRAVLLSGCVTAREAGPRSAVELKEAAQFFDEAAALSDAPAQRVGFTRNAGLCRSQTAAM